jgi:hypothetical protein
VITPDLIVRRISKGEVCETCEKKIEPGQPMLVVTFTIKLGVWPIKKAVDVVMNLCVPCATGLHVLLGERLLEK